MKIGVLTMPNTDNFGASLQAVALCKMLNSLGCNAELINYQNAKMDFEQKTRNHRVITSAGELIKFVVTNKANKKRDRKFFEFENLVDKFPLTKISSTEELEKVCDRYDKVVVGSDQVWNLNITGNDYNFFLEFLRDSNKKASYAPSFGVSRLTEEEIGKISMLLKDFRHLSIRENQGKQMIKNMIGIDVEEVLDPTMLLDDKKWIKMAKKIKLPKNYILLYTVRESESLKQLAKKVALKEGLKVIHIGGSIKHIFGNNYRTIRGIGPHEWLYIFMNANYVLTNSFHGTVFSINFKVPFYIEFLSQSENINSRLENIIDNFELQDRVINNGSTFNLNKELDWNYITTKLNEKRNSSIKYLQSIIEDSNE